MTRHTKRRSAAVPAGFRDTYDRLVTLDAKPWSRRNQNAIDAILKEIDEHNPDRSMLPGRIVYIPHADGYAIYYITSSGLKRTKLLHLPIGDAWHSPVVASDGSIPTWKAQALVAAQDWLANLGSPVTEAEIKDIRG